MENVGSREHHISDRHCEAKCGAFDQLRRDSHEATVHAGPANPMIRLDDHSQVVLEHLPASRLPHTPSQYAIIPEMSITTAIALAADGEPAFQAVPVCHEIYRSPLKSGNRLALISQSQKEQDGNRPDQYRLLSSLSTMPPRSLL